MIYSFFIIFLISPDQNRDFYSILNVTNDADKSVIRNSYMKLSRLYHPDRNNTEKAQQLYMDVSDAYNTLYDDNKRRIYDLYGEAGVHLYESPQTSADSLIQTPRSLHPDSSTEKIRKVGKTLKIDFPIDLSDIYDGKRHYFYVTRSNMCRCKHKGYYCEKCGGKPTILEDIKLQFFIDRGLAEGSVFTFKNCGDVSEGNGSGDIQITIVTKPHHTFKRVGDDLHINVNVTLYEALFGFTRKIETLTGKSLEIVSKQIVAGKKTLVVKGEGLPKYMFPDEYGDLIVHTTIEWPKDISQERLDRLGLYLLSV